MDGGSAEKWNSVYRECLRNHAASLGSYATDGCGEFTVEEMSEALQCAACGCHRNFHRKVKYPAATTAATPETTVVEYGEGGRVVESGSGSKKRFRSKFTAEQKEKMLAFAEKLGWKLQRKDMDDEIERFCKGVGVSRQVFKVWMHNHKNSSSSSSASASTGNVSSLTQ
ncbi:zinc-finger homeodomain protein 2-like [Abrus precatorius]|uniref:Zinc-finger homeodomain protein 2-like n=1 Tax=Abrus precatorius TaxID=3816 RepID=A0A8B8KJ20_ABRPR|nr:zinc-finger homeodomain protein 2-like [Abrus precatorius]